MTALSSRPRPVAVVVVAALAAGDGGVVAFDAVELELEHPTTSNDRNQRGAPRHSTVSSCPLVMPRDDRRLPA